MEPETRTLFDAESEIADAYVQKAIPWCTTHDRQADPETLEYENKYCFEAGSDERRCTISFGDPDHKWWKDSDGT